MTSVILLIGFLLNVMASPSVSFSLIVAGKVRSLPHGGEVPLGLDYGGNMEEDKHTSLLYLGMG